MVRTSHRIRCSNSAPTARCRRKQKDDIDLDCGGIVEGVEMVDEAGERIFHLMLGTASGRKTKSELRGYGQNEFVPWQLGR